MVDENLFGEPLKNKLIMARSKSMEAISAPPEAEPPQPVSSGNKGNELFIRRKGHPGGLDTRPERPRTALATMRTGREKEPEFQQQTANTVQVITRDSVRSLIVPQQQEGEPPPLVLTRRDFERILNAAKVRKGKGETRSREGGGANFMAVTSILAGGAGADSILPS